MKKSSYLYVFLIFCVSFIFLGCKKSAFFSPISDQDLSDSFTRKNTKHQVKRFAFQDYNTRYVEVGNDSLPLLVCLHGSPGSLGSYANFYSDTSFLNHFQLLIFDRLGYGGSNFGKISTSIELQADAILPVLKEYKAKKRKIYLVGSSYGGSVAASVAMKSPELFDAIFFISSSLIPEQETTYWISYPKPWSFFKKIFPAVLDFATQEKLTHKQALMPLQNHWAKITCSVGFLHGLDDKLVYFQNVKTASEKLINAKNIEIYSFEGQGHSLYWNYPDIVKNTLIEFFNKNEIK
ncbi:MAG: alpha/beta hydrolase [Bacteroidetes bacterium]|nr:MAG: alpha/beta hydrolase [Bacteroidota bacterium]TAG89108.1 MAG: alpha/beta hydrolase [Bacteroidota bacterium]